MTVQSFNTIDVSNITDPVMATRLARVNCLGSLYYFIKIGLRRKKLTDHLHKPICRMLEKDHIKDLLEIARDHFKSTMCGEGLPMWGALPFTNQDEDLLRQYNYGDEFIAWMRRKHNPDIRNLLVSENITNAAKLGSKIRWHFESNATYRTLFPETLPDTSCTWTTHSLHVKRTQQGGAHGEGTFDFLGVGGALQSRHYNGVVVQDDLVGRKAIESSSIMDKTIDYHKLLIGAYEDDDANHEGNELVVGNRWGFHDLNSHIREDEPWFEVTSHSALGGCCGLHAPDTPIMPEVFSLEKLEKIKRRLGNYHFSCQFLNNPAAPENADFKIEWLTKFLILRTTDGRRYLRFEVKDGIVRKDIFLSQLAITVITDPAHATNASAGRCRHAIVVVATDGEGNYFLLESWAQATNYDAYFGKLYELAKKYRVRKVGFETIAAQKFAAYHIGWRNATVDWPIRIHELKGEVENEDGTLTRNKQWRIRNVIEPMAEFGNLFINERLHDFIGEYSTFPRGRYVDQLDAFAYAPQVLGKGVVVSYQRQQDLRAQHHRQMALVNQPYSTQRLVVQ